MNKSTNVNITKELKNPSVAGTHHRLLCMTGPNKGIVYYLTGKRIIIGRAETADIHIVDVKISREHAELSFADNSYTITDIGAENGIIVNDKKITQKKLLDTEKIIIGQTVFKYNIVLVANNQVSVFKEANSTGQLKSTGIKDQNNSKKSQVKNQTKSKPLILGVVICVVLYVLMSDDNTVQTSKPYKSNKVSDFDNPDIIPKKSTQDDSESTKKLNGYIHSGRREFSEGNYFRAIEDFRLALLIKPNDGHASFYLAKSKQRLDEDIDKNFLKGKQEYEAKKFQASIISYCGVVQLIQNYPNDERYKNALQKINAIELELGMEKGEVKCVEEKSADSSY